MQVTCWRPRGGCTGSGRFWSSLVLVLYWASFCVRICHFQLKNELVIYALALHLVTIQEHTLLKHLSVTVFIVEVVVVVVVEVDVKSPHVCVAPFLFSLPTQGAMMASILFRLTNPQEYNPTSSYLALE